MQQATLPLPDNHKHEAAYRRWRLEHGEAFDTIKRFALEAAAKHGRIGIGAIVERARWYYYYERGESHKYAYNNNYRSLIARDLGKECPSLADRFETRTLRAIRLA